CSCRLPMRSGVASKSLPSGPRVAGILPISISKCANLLRHLSVLVIAKIRAAGLIRQHSSKRTAARRRTMLDEQIWAVGAIDLDRLGSLGSIKTAPMQQQITPI